MLNDRIPAAANPLIVKFAEPAKEPHLDQNMPRLAVTGIYNVQGLGLFVYMGSS